MKAIYYQFLYRPLMKLAHRYHWHYASPIYPDGDTQLLCQWCGFRQVIRRRTHQIYTQGEIEATIRKAYEEEFRQAKEDNGQ